MHDTKVAVLLEDLRSQFRTFGEGLQMMNEKMDKGFEALNNRMVETRMDRMETKMDHMETSNRQEHQQIIQTVKDLDNEVKRLDTEVVQIKRVK
jgi:predicted  nucleic acid-binding Zn-ribbon protein